MNESVSSGVTRRAQIGQSIQSETGIDAAMIEKLVRRFYERVRADCRGVVLGKGARFGLGTDLA